MTETHHLGRLLYEGKYYALRYEDLLARPYEMMGRVWNLLGVEPRGLEERVLTEMERNPDADWQQEKAPKLASALEKGREGSWREIFTAEDRAIFKREANEVLLAWGYEDNSDW